jgi:cytochrome o ubiquinol oxidase operon protein cyoD
MSGHDESYRRDLRHYLVGTVLALVLTASAFAVVVWRVAPPGGLRAIVALLGLAQVVVHFYYFLHIDLRKSVRDDLRLILFSALIILIMACGTLVIMSNLRHRMM